MTVGIVRLAAAGALLAALGATVGNVHALGNGKWNSTLSCGPREDLTPVRPGFSNVLPPLTIANQQFSLNRTYKEPKNTVSEEWRGQFSGGGWVATGTARRDNGDVWNYELRGADSNAPATQLQGFMSFNGQRIRKCTLDLVLAEAGPGQPQAQAPAPAQPAAGAQVPVGVQSNVLLRLNLDGAVARCNIEVISPGIGNREYEVSAPAFEVQVPVLAGQEGSLPLQWRGKTKIRGLNSVQACPGSGTVMVVARAGSGAGTAAGSGAGGAAAQVRAKWTTLLAGLTPEQSECVRFGIAHRNLKIESIDPAAQLVSPEAPEAKAVFAKCDAYLARRLKTDYECTVLNGIRARCDERYAEERDGRLVSLRGDDALRAHFDDRPLRVSGFETIASVEARKQGEAQQRQAEERRREQDAAARAAAARNASRSAAAPQPASAPSAAPVPAPAPRPVRGE